MNDLNTQQAGEREAKALALADKLNGLCVAEFAWPYLNDAATLLRDFALAPQAAPPADADDAIALLRMFQTGLGSSRKSCSIYDKTKWDRIDAACAALAAKPAAARAAPSAGDEVDPEETVGDLAKRMGAWETPEGYVSFGSWMALAAFRHNVIAGAAKQWRQMEADRTRLASYQPTQPTNAAQGEACKHESGRMTSDGREVCTLCGCFVQASAGQDAERADIEVVRKTLMTGIGYGPALTALDRIEAARAKPTTAGNAGDAWDASTAAVHQACVAMMKRFPDDEAGFVRMTRDACIDAILAARQADGGDKS